MLCGTLLRACASDVLLISKVQDNVSRNVRNVPELFCTCVFLCSSNIERCALSTLDLGRHNGFVVRAFFFFKPDACCTVFLVQRKTVTNHLGEFSKCVHFLGRSWPLTTEGVRVSWACEGTRQRPQQVLLRRPLQQQLKQQNLKPTPPTTRPLRRVFRSRYSCAFLGR